MELHQKYFVVAITAIAIAAVFGAPTAWLFAPAPILAPGLAGHASVQLIAHGR